MRRNSKHYAEEHQIGERIVSSFQLEVGLFMISERGTFHEILRLFPENPEQYGRPSILEMTYPLNLPQRISFRTAQEYYIFSAEEHPEYLL